MAGQVGLQAPGLQALRSLLLGGCSILFTAALAHIPLADATAVGFASPLITVALAALILRPVAFKYRSKRDGAAWRSTWDWALFVGGFVPALIFGESGGGRFDEPGPAKRQDTDSPDPRPAGDEMAGQAGWPRGDHPRRGSELSPADPNPAGIAVPDPQVGPFGVKPVLHFVAFGNRKVGKIVGRDIGRDLRRRHEEPHGHRIGRCALQHAAGSIPKIIAIPQSGSPSRPRTASVHERRGRGKGIRHPRTRKARKQPGPLPRFSSRSQ